jgi:hypothetical protein
VGRRILKVPVAISAQAFKHLPPARPKIYFVVMERALDTVVEQGWFEFSVLFLLSLQWATPAVRSQRLIDGTAPFGNG